MTVQMVLQVEDPRKSRPGRRLLVPGSRCVLRSNQIVDGASDGRVGGRAGADESDERPCRLRRLAGSLSLLTGIRIRIARLADPTVSILHAAQPRDSDITPR